MKSKIPFSPLGELYSEYNQRCASVMGGALYVRFEWCFPQKVDCGWSIRQGMNGKLLASGVGGFGDVVSLAVDATAKFHRGEVPLVVGRVDF